MQLEDKLRKKYGSQSPFTVPDDYFESFSKRMMAKLPEYPEKPKVEKLSMWQKMRPYIYLAAMFAGIWCMMKVFYSAATTPDMLDNPPEAVAIAMNDAATYDYFSDRSNESNFIVEEEVCKMYGSFDEFEKDFNAL